MRLRLRARVSLLSTASRRFVARALLVGLLAFGGFLEDSTSWDGAVVRSAIVAGVVAGCEYLTNLNPDVGPTLRRRSR